MESTKARTSLNPVVDLARSLNAKTTAAEEREARAREQKMLTLRRRKAKPRRRKRKKRTRLKIKMVKTKTIKKVVLLKAVTTIVEKERLQLRPKRRKAKMVKKRRSLLAAVAAGANLVNDSMTIFLKMSSLR